jgi:hypothetical protein
MKVQSGGTISCQHQCAVRGFDSGGAHCIQSDCSLSSWNDYEFEEAYRLLRPAWLETQVYFCKSSTVIVGN